MIYDTSDGEEYFYLKMLNFVMVVQAKVIIMITH